MSAKPTYEQLVRRVRDLEDELLACRPTPRPKARGGGRAAAAAGNSGAGDMLQMSEDRFRSVCQTSPDAVSIIRIADGCFADINEGFTAFTGYGRDEVVGQAVADRNIWQEKDAFPRLVNRLLAGESIFNQEAGFRDKSGRPKAGAVSAMVMSMAAEPHVVTVIRDIDVLKKTREALEISVTRFRELFHNMSSGVVVFKALSAGSDFTVVDCNRAAEQIEGIGKEKLVGNGVETIFPEAKKTGLFDVLQRVWKTGEPEHYPTALYRNGSLLSWKENYVYKLPLGEIITVYDDVTERKLAEDKLLAYQQQLQSLTMELSLVEERQRRSIATDLHDHIGQTLSVSNMKLSALQECVSAGDLRAPLAEISRLLQQTIQYTRSLTFELSPPVLYELGLEAALEWCAENFQKKHGIACEYVSDGQPKPLGDDMRVILFRAVLELFANILKHASARHVKVSGWREGGLVKILVADDGVGFETSELAGRAAETHAFGLFNIRERLGHLGGQLLLESVEGQGTRVTLSAPLESG